MMMIRCGKLRHGPKAISLKKVRGWSIAKSFGHENLKLLAPVLYAN